MDDLIITVTVDSSMSYPGNKQMPPIEDTDAVAEEYIRAIDAGASLVHHHGVHYLEHAIAADGKQLSHIDFDGWQSLTEKIRSARDAIIQFGIASARLEEKIRLMELRPEMMSYAFNVHDEYFQPDPAYPANEMYSLHPRDDLQFIRERGLLDDPVWATLLVGWPGGAWTPPTPDSILYLTNHLPPRANWNLSVMDPATQWKLMPIAIATGGHVRVGWEDNPYLPDGSPSKTNAELVDVVVRMADCIGRKVAGPNEARRIIGLTK
jgi:3-keto-5-aminohexanoate cleavage enzyme